MLNNSMGMNRDTYCSLATAGFDYRQGHVCCHIKSQNKFDSHHALNNDKELKTLREDLANGIKNPLCDFCWTCEKNGVVSKRQQFSKHKTESETEEENQSKQLKHLVIDSGNVCNLACRTCQPEISSGLWIEFQAKLGDKMLDKKPYKRTPVESILANDLTHLETIEVLGGEPFKNFDHLNVLEHLVEKGMSKKISLAYVTNGTVPVPDKLKEISTHFNKIDLCLSIDATGDLFEYIRSNGRWHDVEENLKEMKALQKESCFTLMIAPSISCLNVLHLPKLTEWLMQNKLVWMLNFVDTPQHYSFSIFNAGQKEFIKEKLSNLKIGKDTVCKKLDDSTFDKGARDRFYKELDFTKSFKKLDHEVYLQELLHLLKNKGG